MHQIQAVLGILNHSRYPVKKAVFLQKLECKDSTLGRIFNEIRNVIGVPIKHSQKLGGYFIDNAEGYFELPGLWFNESELFALLVSQKLLKNAEPGFFSQQIQPLNSKIAKIFSSSHRNPSSIASKVKILQQAHRSVDSTIFQTLATALLDNRQIRINFYNREKNQSNDRNISPLKLVFYRDNWYLDAWCHQREDFRTFSLTNIKQAETLSLKARQIDCKIVDDYFTSAYGIFSGEASNIAVLHFNAHRARWVAGENWHPQQKHRWLDNGDYELLIPYSDHRELIMDILKYGADVKVISPDGLQKEIQQQLEKSLALYQQTVTI